MANVVIYGASNIGKTKLLAALRGKIYRETYNPTSVCMVKTSSYSNGKLIRFWDLAGTAPVGYVNECLKSTDMVLIVFDATNKTSFELLKQNFTRFRICPSRAHYILIGTKIDRVDRQVPSLEARKFATDKHLPYFEVSAKTKTDIKKLNQHLILHACLETRLKKAENQKKRAQEKINALRELSTSHLMTQQALTHIADILDLGLNEPQPSHYFISSKSEIERHLKLLRYSNRSVLNLILNTFIVVFAACCVIGIPLLWLSGALSENQKQHGEIFMFFSFGDMQKAKTAIHHSFEAAALIHSTAPKNRF